MTIYKITIKVERPRFMESPYRFTETMYVIADSYDQAINYVRSRIIGESDKEIDLTYERVLSNILGLFDVREIEEKVIV